MSSVASDAQPNGPISRYAHSWADSQKSLTDALQDPIGLTDDKFRDLLLEVHKPMPSEDQTDVAKESRVYAVLANTLLHRPNVYSLKTRKLSEAYETVASILLELGRPLTEDDILVSPLNVDPRRVTPSLSAEGLRVILSDETGKSKAVRLFRAYKEVSEGYYHPHERFWLHMLHSQDSESQKSFFNGHRLSDCTVEISHILGPDDQIPKEYLHSRGEEEGMTPWKLWGIGEENITGWSDSEDELGDEGVGDIESHADTIENRPVVQSFFCIKLTPGKILAPDGTLRYLPIHPATLDKWTRDHFTRFLKEREQRIITSNSSQEDEEEFESDLSNAMLTGFNEEIKRLPEMFFHKDKAHSGPTFRAIQSAVLREEPVQIESNMQLIDIALPGTLLENEQPVARIHCSINGSLYPLSHIDGHYTDRNYIPSAQVFPGIKEL